MRKFFYSISVILFLGILTFGYYETYRLADSSENTEFPGTVVMADGNREEGGYGSYYLTEKEGHVLVCLSDKKTVYETTSIRMEALPEGLQDEIRNGKFLRDQQELYSFLENYSS